VTLDLGDRMVWQVLGSVGGIVALLTAVWLILRGIFKWISATEANTEALKELTKIVAKSDERLDNHETRLVVLEDHDRNRHGSTP
jgi:hypothetical protein